MSAILNFQNFFKGFQDTPLLWEESNIYNFKQQIIPKIQEIYKPKNSQVQLRLGHWIERFVLFQLKHQKQIKIIAQNTQIKDLKRTLGELDVLLFEGDQPIHLEICYKFYLYDDSKVFENPLEYWIGPNRKDTLVDKLDKLRQKQFPLLYHSITESILNTQNLRAHKFQQKILFKAQLFTPYGNSILNIEPLNEHCISGFYLPFKNFSILKNYQFYVPSKLEWLTKPYLNIDWQSYKDISLLLEEHIRDNRSPMLWLKDRDDAITKCFITWW